MQATSNMDAQRIQASAGFALIEVLTELAVSACRFLARQAAAIVKARRQAQARAELQNLSDHFLRDIGLERRQIDNLFR